MKKKLDRKKIKVTQLENDSPAKLKTRAGKKPGAEAAQPGEMGARAPKPRPKRRKSKSVIRKGKSSPAKWVQAAMALAPVAAEMLKSKNKKED